MGESRRRRFAVLSLEDDDLDRITKGDERFFARHPHRHHRLRLAGRAEVEALKRIHGPEAARLNMGDRLFAVVKLAFAGGHLKAFTANKADAETDVPEILAAHLFDRITSRDPGMSLLEATMRRMAAEEDRP